MNADELPKLAVFDCDGTLVDGQADVCDTMEEAFATAGLPLPERNIVRRLVGLSLPVAIAKLAPDVPRDQQFALVDSFKTIFRARRNSGLLNEPLYDGIEALLRTMHKDGWLLAVATGKSDRGLNACLDTHGIRDLFVSLQTADRHPSKPHPAMLEAALSEAGVAPSETVMIGDTSFDMEMGRAAHVRSIGVAWGYHEASELMDTGASAVAANMAHLETLL